MLVPTVEELIEQVCKEYHVSCHAVMSRDRHKQVAKARRMIFAKLRVHPFNFSLPEIGRIMGRDHTTVLLGLRKCKELGEYDDQRA